MPKFFSKTLFFKRKAFPILIISTIIPHLIYLYFYLLALFICIIAHSSFNGRNLIVHLPCKHFSNYLSQIISLVQRQTKARTRLFLSNSYPNSFHYNQSAHGDHGLPRACDFAEIIQGDRHISFTMFIHVFFFLFLFFKKGEKEQEKVYFHKFNFHQWLTRAVPSFKRMKITAGTRHVA